LFFGHLFGLLTPLWVWDTLGVTHSLKQMVALIAGGIMGTVCLAGLGILLYRRLANARIRAVTRKRDWLLLSWILGALLLGLLTITESAKHSDGEMMVSLMMWAQHLLTFQGDAASFMLDAPWLFKLHVMMGMTLFVIFPFTRLVHVWSGFASVTYLIRPWQLVRKR
jgi:nitrate reductase gamma subunit